MLTRTPSRPAEFNLNGDTAHVGKNPGFPKGKARRVRKRGAHLRKNLGFPKATQGELAKGANKTEASWQQEGPTK